MPSLTHGRICNVERPAGVVQPVGGDAPELTARVAGPAGNVIGLSREPPAPAAE